MRTRLYGKWAAWAAGLAVLALLMSLPPTLLAQVYDVGPKLSSDGTPVPDVDKPNLADQSCWLAAAANVLGGAGWGVGANAQAKAVNIYTNDLMPHFGNGVMLGWSSVAINWWLLNHGYNPNSPDYNPNLKYNNVTIIQPPPGFVNLTMPQYDWLLNQISTCQYVNVSFDPPSPGHEMTLVGGNFSNTAKPAGSVSLWHDNNGDFQAGVDTEVDPNVPPANNTWFINHRNLPNFYGTKIATVLCPGLQKPDAAMQNFDIAWFKDMKQVGGNDVLFNAQRVAGNKAGQYHGPDGSTNLEWAGTTLQPEAVIPNQMMPEPWYKEVFLLVDYIDQNVLAAFPGIANITLKVGNNIYVPEVTWDDDNGQALFYWNLSAENGQPPSESLVFPDASYKNLYDISTGLGGPVKDWDVATLCSPEPATLMLLVVGGGLAILRRRRTVA